VWRKFYRYAVKGRALYRPRCPCRSEGNAARNARGISDRGVAANSLPRQVEEVPATARAPEGREILRSMARGEKGSARYAAGSAVAPRGRWQNAGSGAMLRIRSAGEMAMVQNHARSQRFARRKAVSVVSATTATRRGRIALPPGVKPMPTFDVLRHDYAHTGSRLPVFRRRSRYSKEGTGMAVREGMG